MSYNECPEEYEGYETPPENSKSALNSLVMPDHDVIYLVPTDEGFDWCCDPAPGVGMDADEAIKYVRADKLDEAIDRIKDMLQGDDGQAWKEAQKFIDRIEV